ncbi:hypothetical protein [Nocardia cyriacigeorgica]|uniref:hypothetical protein n=1 Tax=Nocardia cyriacigeorgica TaxID=135487 RepID=UPI0024540D59|nr:hypothetical protein [Nocardia cyriacigeorgica]
MGDSFLVVDAGWATALSRAGLVIVTSAGEKDSTSLEPVGRICRKSPSDGSPRAMTLPERPSGIPTAAAVNHTMGGRPAAISVAICAISVSDKGCGVFLDFVRGDDMGLSGQFSRFVKGPACTDDAAPHRQVLPEPGESTRRGHARTGSADPYRSRRSRFHGTPVAIRIEHVLGMGAPVCGLGTGKPGRVGEASGRNERQEPR